MDGEDDGLDRLPFDIIIEKVHGQKGFTQEFDKKRGEPGREGRCAKRRGRDVSDDFGFPFYLTLSLVAQMLILFLPGRNSLLRNI